MADTRTAYTRDLFRLARTPSIQLKQLENLWPAAEESFRRARLRLLRHVPKDDPIRNSVDLLQSIKCVADEALHSLALAYALDYRQKHELGKEVLVALLQKVCDLFPRAGAARVLKRVQKRSAVLTVTPEYRFRLEGFQNRSIARSDIWVEAKVRKHSALIVIENKIRSGESDGQLSWYEKKADAWCKKHGARYLLVFLTRDGYLPKSAKTDRWVAISYLQLAAALRLAWWRKRRAAGAAWLGLYISSIVRGLLGMRIERFDSVALADLKIYLGMRHSLP